MRNYIRYILKAIFCQFIQTGVNEIWFKLLLSVMAFLHDTNKAWNSVLTPELNEAGRAKLTNSFMTHRLVHSCSINLLNKRKFSEVQWAEEILKMNAIPVIQLLVIYTTLVTSQKFYKAKFSDCGEIKRWLSKAYCMTFVSIGSILKIAPALQGSVSITAPYNIKKGRHILGKVLRKYLLYKSPSKIFFLGQKCQDLHQWNSCT